ncbi:MAG: hypothetical protein EOO27_51270, partial [Comamonadaceae bacterium]
MQQELAPKGEQPDWLEEDGDEADRPPSRIPSTSNVAMRILNSPTNQVSELTLGALRLERVTAHGAPSLLVVGRGRSSPSTLDLLHREYSLRGRLNAGWSAVPLTILPRAEGAILVLEDPGGVPLRQQDICGQPVNAFIKIALSLVTAVAEMHASGLV